MGGQSAYDRWLTTPPEWRDEEPPVFRCTTCGVFLNCAPDGTREWCEVGRCDGEAAVIECRYNDGTHEEVLAIIGEEFRDKGFTIAYTPACGTRDGRNAFPEEEISPREAESYRHAPHFYADPYHGYAQAAVRICPNGHVNEERTL